MILLFPTIEKDNLFSYLSVIFLTLISFPVLLWGIDRGRGQSTGHSEAPPGCTAGKALQMGQARARHSAHSSADSRAYPARSDGTDPGAVG